MVIDIWACGQMTSDVHAVQYNVMTYDVQTCGEMTSDVHAVQYMTYDTVLLCIVVALCYAFVVLVM